MHLKIDRILGRTDDMFIIRKLNIFPQHLKAELMRFPEVGQNYHIVLEGYDELIVKVELNNIFHYTIIKQRDEDEFSRTCQRDLFLRETRRVLSYLKELEFRYNLRAKLDEMLYNVLGEIK